MSAKLNKDLAQHTSNHKQAPANKLKPKRKKPGKATRANRGTRTINAPTTARGLARTIVKDKRPDVTDSEFAYWLKSLEYPSRYPEPICPVGFNPVPSLFKTTARTFKTMLSFAVAAGTQTNIFLFPGHGSNRIGASGTIGAGTVIPNAMDAVSYHAVMQNIGPTLTYNVGPMVVAAAHGTCGGLMQTGSIVGDIAASNTALVSYSALTYDKPLPYSTVITSDSAAHGAHARWQLTSARIKAVNTTPSLSRGGSVITVMPMNGGTLPDGTGAVLQMASNPSFYDHGPSMKADGEGVSWLPRPQDIAFWHTVHGNNIAPSGILSNVGLCCFIAAPAAGAQTYDIQIDWNWMLSGDFLQGISTPNPTRNEHLPQVATSVQIMQEGAKSAVGISGVHEAVAKSAWHEAGTKVFNMAKSAIKEGFSTALAH